MTVRAPSTAPRVGVVLGAGGILGGAWHLGALHAIATETGWDRGSADLIVGTSAGAVVGGLLACGVPPWLMVDHANGEDFAGVVDTGDDSSGERGGPGATFRLHRRLYVPGPGSWRLALSSLARPYRHSPAALIAGWLPRGLVSTEPLKETMRRACPGSWPAHPGFRAVAVDYASGRRVVFGREDAPAASLPDAVAASCAIPGFFHPVRIDGRDYVDGGVRSTSNLDVLAREHLDLVIALNPMSSLHAGAPRHVAERLALSLRERSGRRLGSEAKRVRAQGTEVILIQPTVPDLDAMGANLMSARNRARVVETAVRTVTAHLRQSPVGERLGQLPAGAQALVQRPPGPTRSWPDLAGLADARAEALEATVYEPDERDSALTRDVAA
jgi:NTE family protein